MREHRPVITVITRLMCFLPGFSRNKYVQFSQKLRSQCFSAGCLFHLIYCDCTDSRGNWCQYKRPKRAPCCFQGQLGSGCAPPWLSAPPQVPPSPAGRPLDQILWPQHSSLQGLLGESRHIPWVVVVVGERRSLRGIDNPVA